MQNKDEMYLHLYIYLAKSAIWNSLYHFELYMTTQSEFERGSLVDIY